MVTCTILIIFAVVIGLIALVSILTMGGALIMVALDLIIFAFAVYGFIKFIERYRNR